MDVPAGWYPDPASPATSARWWDGTSWTDHTRGLDDLTAPEQPATPSYAAPSADTVVVPVAPQSPDFVAPFVPASPAAPASWSDTAVYPSGSAYDATLFPETSPARPSSSPHWGILVLVGPLVVVLLVAAVLLVKGLASGAGSSTAARPTPTPSPPQTPSQTPTDPATTTPGTTSPQAVAAGKVLETFKPAAATLPAGIEATLIPGGDVAAGQRTLDGWCSTSYASEKDRIARRQWALTQDGQSIGLSVEVVAYGTPEQAAAALAEFTARTNDCSGVEVDQDGVTITQDVVSAKRMTGLPTGISGYRAVATMSGQTSDGTPIRVNSTSTVQRKGPYLSIVWTNQSTTISAADQHVIDGFVAQQTKALAATS